MFTEPLTFPIGILIGKQLFREATLEEETFGTTLKASTMPGLDASRLDDEAYFSAAKMAVRLTVPGLFEARMASDQAFQLLVEEYAENRDWKVSQVSSRHVHPVSPELVIELHRLDGRLLLGVSALLEERRSEFRKAALAPKDGSTGNDEARVPGRVDPEEEPGGD